MIDAQSVATYVQRLAAEHERYVDQCGQLVDALHEVYDLATNVEDPTEAATRVSHVALDALVDVGADPRKAVPS